MNKNAQGHPPLRRHGFIKSTPLEGRSAPPPWWLCLVGDLCFLCSFWLVTRQSDTSCLRFRGVTKWPTQACTIPGVGEIRSGPPDAVCPGLHWKPLDATIGRLLAPHCPGGHQGSSKQKNNDKRTNNFAGRFEFRWPWWYGGTWRRFIAFLKATKRHQRASTCSDNINWTQQCRLFVVCQIVEKGHNCPLLPIGVWHIKLMRST